METKKHITDEKTGINYTLQNNYYLPNLTLPTEEEEPIGIWGQQHRRYLKQHRRITYYNLLTSGKLNAYLADIDRRAEDMFFRLVKQMADFAGVTEVLKADDAMKWTGLMNNIRNRAAEVVYSDLIYN